VQHGYVQGSWGVLRPYLMWAQWGEQQPGSSKHSLLWMPRGAMWMLLARRCSYVHACGGDSAGDAPHLLWMLLT
jgi:hypothetical protein